MKAQEIHEIDPARVKVFVHRERDRAKFERIKADIKRRGQIHPAQVRDIRHLPKSERERSGGGFYDYGLITGEGRLLIAKELGINLRAFVEEEKEVKVVGMFLAENLNREPLPWATKAKLIKPLLDAGVAAEEIAERHSLSVGHVLKFARILDKTATGLEQDIESMAMNDAEALTSLPAAAQAIVMEVFHETKDSQIRELVRKAQAVTEESGEPLSKTGLRKSIQRVDEDLRRLRDQLKLTRLHWSLGVQNLQALLSERKFRAACQRAGINVAKFEKVAY